MIYVNNGTISLRNNQEKNKYYKTVVDWLKGTLSEKIEGMPLLNEYICTKNRIKILQTIIKFCGIYNNAYLSQEHIARLSGVHHDTVWRTLKLFNELGIIKKRYRGVKQTCIYSLGSFLHDVDVKWALRELLPNLFWAISNLVVRCKEAVMGLVSPLAAIFKQDTAQLFNNKNKYINTSKTQIVQEVKREVTDHDIAKYEQYVKDEEVKKKDFAKELQTMLGFHV